jgi:hypothetical protein
MSADSRIALTLPARDFSLDWRRYNLVANYIAEYASYYYEHKDRAENVISSVFYELLEHMATISREDADLALRLASEDGRVLFEIASSGVDPQARARHEELVAGLGREGLEAGYKRILEDESDAEDHRGKLSLVLLAHDYHAEISTRAGASGSVVLQAAVAQDEMNP